MKAKPLLALNLLWAALVIGGFYVGSMITKSRMSPVVEDETGIAAVPERLRQFRAEPAEDSPSPRMMARRSPVPVPGGRPTRVVVIESSQDFAKLVETDLDEAKRVFASVGTSGAYPDVVTRQQYGSMIVRELLTRDLDQAISFSDGEFIWWNSSIEKLAAEVGKQRGVDALLKWIEDVEYRSDEVSQLDYKKVAARTALAIVIGEEPGRARSWVIANAGQPYADGDTIQRIAMAVDENPGLQLTWLAELPIGASARRDGIGGIFSGYLSSDLDAAARWLAEQELGPIYDLAIQQVADAAAEFDREVARIWAEEISDEALRAATLKRLDLLE